MAPLWCALAVVAGVADDEAVTLAARLTTAAPSGLMTLVHRPGMGWGLTFATPLSDEVLTCTRGPNDTRFSCSRGAGHTAEWRPDIATFVDALAVPPSRWLAVSVLRGARGDEAELTLRDGDTFEQRLLVRASSGDFRVTQALPLLSLDGSSFPPRLVSRPSPELAVLAYEDGGNGNNASGFVRYRLVRLVEEGSLLAVTATIELGGGGWGRAVTEDGFFASSSVDILCPQLERTGVFLARVCSGSVDPRGAPTFERLCSATPRCARPPDRRTPPGAGRWIIRRRGLQRLRAQSLRAAGASPPLVLTEAVVANGRVEGLELHNPGATAIELSMLTVGNAAEASLEVGQPCVIDGGEHLWLAGDDASPACTLVRAELPVAQPVEDAPTELVVRSPSWVDGDGVLRPGRPLVRRRVSDTADDEPETGSPRSWQLDPRGLACLAEPSPGHPNAPCQAKERQPRREQ